jgi:hypothetical protein
VTRTLSASDPNSRDTKVSVDVDALAGGLQLEVANRLGAMVAYLCENMTEQERAALVAAALRHMDGLEAWFAGELGRELGG